MIITKEFDFDAAHRLATLPKEHKCFQLHGHTYRVRIEVSGPIDPICGWIIDYAIIKAAWDTVDWSLDHKYLNDVPGLEVPTTEVLALWILKRLRIVSMGKAEVVALTVFESATTSCRVTVEDLPANPIHAIPGKDK